MTIRIYREIKRATAVVLSFSLIWTSGNVADAALIIPQAFAGVVLPPQFNLVPPAQLGRVADYFTAPTSGKKLVVLIQDLHAHYGVQKNIAGLLDFISQKLDKKNANPLSVPFALAVEGAQGPVDSSVMALFPDQQVKEAASDYLMRQGELTGVEYFGITRGIADLPVGVENRQYYELHRDLFRKTLADREELVGMLKGIRTDIHSLQGRIYGPGLKSFQATLDGYDKGEIGIDDFVRQLVKERNTLGIPWKQDFPELAHYVTTFGENGAQSGLPTSDQLRGYTTEFLKQAQSAFSREERQMLMILAKQQSTTGYFLYLRDLVEKHRLFLAIPVELARYLEYLHTTQTIGMDHITHEAMDLAFQIKLRKAPEGAEQDLVQVEHDLSLLISMANVQATEMDVKAFGPRMNQFIALCHSLLVSNGVQTFNEEKIRRLISSSIDYYAMALIRNKPMVENTLALMDGKVPSETHQVVSAIPTRSSHDTVVLVTGGFHTESLAALLRQQNISYVVITPTVNQVTEADQALYIKRLNGELLTPQDIFVDAKINSSNWYAKRPMSIIPAGLQPGMGLVKPIAAVTALFAIGWAVHNGHLPDASSLDLFIRTHLAWAHLPAVGPVLAEVKNILVTGGATAAVILPPTSRLTGKESNSPSPIPLIPFVAAMQTYTRKQLSAAIHDHSIGALLSRISERAQKGVAGAYQSLIYHQFTQLETRPIIELLLNAIDTEARYAFRQGHPDHRKNVYWSVTDGHTAIRDEGEGLNLEDLTKLLYPAEGGNLGQAGTTGRFGAGFLSIFSYLQGNADNRIIIRSVTDKEQNRFEFFLDSQGNLQFIWLPLSEEERGDLHGHGTIIDIFSQAIQRDALIAEAKNTLHAKADAAIWMEEPGKSPTALNAQDDMRTLALVPMQELGNEYRNVYPAVALKTADSPQQDPEAKTEIRICVNGVYFYSIEVPGYGQPKSVILDFQKDVIEYARDRSGLLPGRLTMRALDHLMKTIGSQELISYAPLLLEMATHFERRLPSSAREPEAKQPTTVLKERIERELLYSFSHKTVVVSDKRLQSLIDAEKSDILFLPKELIPDHLREQSLSRRADADGIVYLPFQPGSESHAVVTRDGTLIVDERLAFQVHDAKKRDEVLALLRSIGEVSQSAFDTSPTALQVKSRARQHVEKSSEEKKSPAVMASPDVEKVIRDKIKAAFLHQRNHATTLHRFALLDAWINGLLFSLENGPGYNMSGPLGRAFGFSLKDTDDQFNHRLESVLDSIRFDKEGTPIMPSISSKARRLVGSHKSFNKFDQDYLFEQAGQDNELLKEILVWIVYTDMTQDILKKEKEESPAWSLTAINSQGIIRRILQAAVALSPEQFTMNLHSAVSQLIRTKYHDFELAFDPYGNLPRIKKISLDYQPITPPVPVAPSYFKRLPQSIKSDFQYVYIALFLALIEKREIKPDQIDGLLQACKDAEALLDDVFSSLSEEEALTVATNPAFKRLGNMDLQAIRRALQTPGKLHAEMLPQLYLHFADTPAVGKAPLRTIATPSDEGVFLPLSTLVYAHASEDHAFEKIEHLSDFADYLRDHGHPDSQELKERAQSAIKRAYEQTTDGLAFLREMATNAYEATRKSTGGKHEFRVSSWVDSENRFVLSMEDAGVGMTLQDLLGNLLQPNVSGWSSELRHFGQGFFTLFRSADQVRLQTTRLGMTTTAYLLPVIKNGVLIDVQVRFSERPALAHEVGTRMEWVKSTPDPAHLGAQIWSELNHYIGLFDPARMTIFWNDAVLNHQVTHLATVHGQNGDVVSISEAAGIQAFNLNQVYMRTLAPEFISSIPATIQKWLLKHGIILNLDSKTAEPLEGRTDFVGRPQRIRDLSGAIATAGIQAALRLLLDGKLDLSDLPNDWIINAEAYSPKASGNPRTLPILLDAIKLQTSSGREININWQPYIEGENADRNSLILLLSVPSVDINGDSYSVFDLIIKAKSDPDFLSQLPPWLQNSVRQALAENNLSQTLQQTDMVSYHVNEAHPSTLQADEGQADVLRVWQSLVTRVLTLAGVSDPRIHEFYTSADNAIAHTRAGQKNIAWNIVSIHDQLIELHNVLKGTSTEPAQAMADVLFRIIETTTHEETHVERGEGEAVWTHTRDFYVAQIEVLNRVLSAYLRHDMPSLSELVEQSTVELRDRLSTQLELPSRFGSEVASSSNSSAAATHAGVNYAIDVFRQKGQVARLPFKDRRQSAQWMALAGEFRLAWRLLIGYYSVNLYGDDLTAELVAGQTAHAGIRTGDIHLARGEYLRLKALGPRALAGRIAHEAKEISRWRQEAHRHGQTRTTMRDWIKAHLPEARLLDKQIHSEGLTLERRVSGDPTTGTYEITEDPFDINIQAHPETLQQQIFHWRDIATTSPDDPSRVQDAVRQLDAIRLLNPSATDRQWIGQALSQIQGPEAIRILFEMQDEPDSITKNSLVRSLKYALITEARRYNVELSFPISDDPVLIGRLLTTGVSVLETIREMTDLLAKASNPIPIKSETIKQKSIETIKSGEAFLATLKPARIDPTINMFPDAVRTTTAHELVHKLVSLEDSSTSLPDLILPVADWIDLMKLHGLSHLTSGQDIARYLDRSYGLQTVKLRIRSLNGKSFPQKPEWSEYKTNPHEIVAWNAVPEKTLDGGIETAGDSTKQKETLAILQRHFLRTNTHVYEFDPETAHWIRHPLWRLGQDLTAADLASRLPHLVESGRISERAASVIAGKSAIGNAGFGPKGGLFGLRGRPMNKPGDNPEMPNHSRADSAPDAKDDNQPKFEQLHAGANLQLPVNEITNYSVEVNGINIDFSRDAAGNIYVKAGDKVRQLRDWVALGSVELTLSGPAVRLVVQHDDDEVYLIWSGTFDRFKAEESLLATPDLAPVSPEKAAAVAIDAFKKYIFKTDDDIYRYLKELNKAAGVEGEGHLDADDLQNMVRAVGILTRPEGGVIRNVSEFQQLYNQGRNLRLALIAYRERYYPHVSIGAMNTDQHVIEGTINGLESFETFYRELPDHPRRLLEKLGPIAWKPLETHEDRASSDTQKPRAMNASEMILAGIVTALWYFDFKTAGKQFKSAWKLLFDTKTKTLGYYLNNADIAALELTLSQAIQQAAPGKQVRVVSGANGFGQGASVDYMRDDAGQVLRDEAGHPVGYEVAINNHADPVLMEEMALHELMHIVRGQPTGGWFAKLIDEFRTISATNQLLRSKPRLMTNAIAAGREAIKSAEGTPIAQLHIVDPVMDDLANAVPEVGGNQRIMAQLQAERRAILGAA